MHVLFVEPSSPPSQREFVRALHFVGARITGVGEGPVEELDDELRRWLYGYERIPSMTDEAALLDCVRRVQARERVDRLEATVEAHLLPAARVREACGIPGTSERTVLLCRDRTAVREALGARPGPAPDASEGAEAGQEGGYDTLTLDGEVVHDFICHHYPGVLEARRTRWISPQLIATNRVDAADYEEVREFGREVIRALGVGTSATHMEWCRGPRGLELTEIGCRPPGACVWDLHCAGNGLDLYVEWAEALQGVRTGNTCSRRYAAGMIALRPDRDGVISGYEGMDEVSMRYARDIIDMHLPPLGTPTRPVEAGYMANAWMRLRHPDFDELRAILSAVGETARVRAEAAGPSPPAGGADSREKA